MILQYSVPILNFLNSLVLCSETKLICSHGDNSLKMKMRTYSKLNFPLKSYTYPKHQTPNCITEKFILLCVQLIRAQVTKLHFNWYRKVPSERGNPSIHNIFIEVFPKISFLLWSIYDHLNLLSHRPRSYEILCPVRKTHADFKCDQSTCSQSISWPWAFNSWLQNDITCHKYAP